MPKKLKYSQQNGKKHKRRKNNLRLANRRKKLVITFMVIVITVLAVLGVIFAFVFLNGRGEPAPDPDTSGTDATSQADTDNVSEPEPTAPPASSVKYELGESIVSPRVVVKDMNTGEIIAGRNADEPAAPASLTKISTAILIARHTTEDETFDVGKELKFVQPGSSSAYLREGFKLSREQLLDGLMLNSGNDASFVAAVHIGKKLGGDNVHGDMDALRYFVDMMNDLSKEIGANNTHFENPNGFDYPTQHSTANDIALYAEELMKYPELAEIVKKSSVSHTLLSGETITYNNTNQLLQSGAYYNADVIGCKTGTTDLAGSCVSIVAERGGHRIIVVVMGAESGAGCFGDADTLVSQTLDLLEQ